RFIEMREDRDGVDQREGDARRRIDAHVVRTVQMPAAPTNRARVDVDAVEILHEAEVPRDPAASAAEVEDDVVVADRTRQSGDDLRGPAPADLEKLLPRRRARDFVTKQRTGHGTVEAIANNLRELPGDRAHELTHARRDDGACDLLHRR